MNTLLVPLRQTTLALALTLVLGGVALAQQGSAEPAADVPPPPGLDESRAGETDVPPPASADEEPVTLQSAEAGAGEKVIPHERTSPPSDEQPLPAKVQTTDTLDPAVTIRRDGDTVIEEYRRDGRVYMVRVVPDKGVAYTYLDTNGDGRLEGDPDEGPIQPVYYTLYEWE